MAGYPIISENKLTVRFWKFYNAVQYSFMVIYNKRLDEEMDVDTLDAEIIAEGIKASMKRRSGKIRIVKANATGGNYI